MKYLCLKLGLLATIVALLVIGCSRSQLPQPVEPAPTPPPAPETTRDPVDGQEPAEAPDDATADAPESEDAAASEQGKTTGEKPEPPKPAEKRRPAPAADPLAMPDGPLDDHKFAVISTRYALAVLALSEDQSDHDSIRLVLRGVLKEADVTETDYRAYADEVAKDSERSDKMALDIKALMDRHDSMVVEGTGAHGAAR